MTVEQCVARAKKRYPIWKPYILWCSSRPFSDMGQNASHNSPSPRPSPQHPQETRKRPQPPRRTSLELPDINRLSLSPLRRPPNTTHTPATIPIPPSDNAQGMVDMGNHLDSSPISSPNVSQPEPSHPRFNPQIDHEDPAYEHNRYPEGGMHTPEVHIHSSIPLGIPLPVFGTSQSSPFQSEGNDGLVQTIITWRGGGMNVFLSGTFESSWRGRVRMIPEYISPFLKICRSAHVSRIRPSSLGVFSVTVRLPPGNHRLKFLVDEQWRCSDDLPTATDNDGHLVNYIEVPNSVASAWDPSETPSPQTSRQQTPFISHIPPHLVHSAVQEERYLSQQLPNPPPIPHPATLPRHLEKVILNAQRHGRDRAVMEGNRDDNSVLPIPNHVVLNHL